MFLHTLFSRFQGLPAHELWQGDARDGTVVRRQLLRDPLTLPQQLPVPAHPYSKWNIGQRKLLWQTLRNIVHLFTGEHFLM